MSVLYIALMNSQTYMIHDGRIHVKWMKAYHFYLTHLTKTERKRKNERKKKKKTLKSSGMMPAMFLSNNQTGNGGERKGEKSAERRIAI